MHLPGTSDGLSRAAATAGLVAAASAREAETDRRLSPAAVGAITSAGFLRHFVAARWGGTEGSFREYLTASAVLAERDPSAAWVAAVGASLGRMAAYLPEGAQKTLWDSSPDTFIACALVPAGRAERVAGGWRISGTWRYLSGVHFSAWALVACPVPVDEGGEEVRFLLVPREAYRIEDSWFTVGMRATGSDSIRMTDVDVEEGFSFPRESLLCGAAPQGAPPGARLPIKMVSGLSFAAPVLGAAKAVVREFAGMLASRRPAEVSAQLALAGAAGEVAAAEQLLVRAATAADDGVRDAAGVATAALDHVTATRLAVRAANGLVELAGTAAQADSAPLQRFWRDINTGASHRVLQFEPAARAYTAVLTGAAA